MLRSTRCLARSRRPTRLLVAIGFVVIAAGAARSVEAGAVTFTAIAGGCGLAANTVSTAVAPAIATFTQTCDTNGGVGIAQAESTASQLGAYAEMRHQGGTSQSAGATALVAFDVIFTGAPGETSTDIGVNLLLDAVFSDPSGSAGGTVGLATQVLAASFFQTVSRSSFQESAGWSQSLGLTVPNLNGTTVMTTTAMSVLLNTPITITIRLNPYAISGTDTETLWIDALNTLWFPASGPIFNLLPGITVSDVPELGIVNNSLTPIPEPGTALLFGVGLAVLRGIGRRRGAV